MTRSRENIREDILGHLAADARVDATAIEIEVTNETVRLDGIQPSWYARQAAEWDATSIEGVSALENRITVRFPPGFHVPMDSQIRSDIEHMLRWDPLIDAGSISVEVLKGCVSLGGTVDVYWKKSRIEEMVRMVGGVTGMENGITVDPLPARDDDLITREIVSAIDRDFSMSVDRVNTSVVNGLVTFTGTVDTWDQSRRAEEIARITLGVVEIHNHLRIIARYSPVSIT